MTKANFSKVAALVVFTCLLLSLSCYAQENITITTYYPSPDGSYNNLDANFLQADRVAVGNGNNPAGLPDGVLNILPLAAAPAGNTGSLYFDSNANVLNYFNGNIWFPIQPATLVAYAGGNQPCIPVGTHVVGVMTIARTGASMEPCDAMGGASAAFEAAAFGEPHCVPASGFIICH